MFIKNNIELYKLKDKIKMEYCIKNNKYTQKQFISLLIKKHGDKYNYSNTIYTGIKNKINVLCEKHGIFSIQSGSHLSGCGCSFCNIEKRTKTTEQFIKEANIIHNYKYDYLNTKYVKAKNKVKIMCKIHGEFEQIPDVHLRGSGCKYCKHVCNGQGRQNKLTTKDFIERSNKIHNNLYDYSLVNYIDNKTNVYIICKTHGKFEQKPNKHISGRGCAKCGGSNTLTTEEFILKSNKIHNKLFDYNNSVYVNADTPIKIKCKVHGIFEQMPRNHYKGYGCPLCNLSKGEQKIKEILDNLSLKYKTQYSFEDLKYIKSLKFDFGITGEKLILIEYNGIQHYEYINFFHRNQENFELYKLKDKIKMEYCIKNNIELIIIKYDQYEKINEILNAKLSTKSAEQV